MAIDPSRLYQQLLNTGLQNKDNPLYQLIRELIRILSSLTTTVTGLTPGSGTTNTFNITNQILGGVAFENGENNEPAIMSVPAGAAGSDTDREWSVLTNGDATNPELIFAGGDVIMTHTP